MSVTEDASFSTRAEAIRFVLREVNLATLSPEVVDWFFYVKDLFGKGGLYDQCDAIIDNELRKKFNILDWEGSWQYIPIPHIKLVIGKLTHLDFETDLYVVASARVEWYYLGKHEPGEYEVVSCVVVAEVKKAVERLAIPLTFLKAAVAGNLSQFQVAEAEFNFTSWQVPGFEHKVRLHNSLIPIWQQVFQKRALGEALEHLGIISPGEAPLVDKGSLAVPEAVITSEGQAPLVDKASLVVPEAVIISEATGLDLHELRVRLQDLGFTKSQIDGAVSADLFPDGCSLETAIGLALQSFGRN